MHAKAHCNSLSLSKFSCQNSSRNKCCITLQLFVARYLLRAQQIFKFKKVDAISSFLNTTCNASCCVREVARKCCNYYLALTKQAVGHISPRLFKFIFDQLHSFPKSTLNPTQSCCITSLKFNVGMARHKKTNLTPLPTHPLVP